MTRIVDMPVKRTVRFKTTYPPIPVRQIRSLELRTEQLQAVTMDTLLEEHGNFVRDLIVKSIIDGVRAHLMSGIERDASLAALKSSGEGMVRLTSRLAQRAVRTWGDDMMGDSMKAIERDAMNGAALLEAIDRICVGKRYSKKGVKQAIAEVHGDSGISTFLQDLKVTTGQYAKAVVEHWNNTKHVHVVEESPDESLVSEQVALLTSEIRSRFPQLELRKSNDKIGTQHNFDVVRESTVCNATERDVDDIASLYNSALLRDITVGMLLPQEGDTDEEIEKRIASVWKRVEKGALVRPMDPDELRQQMFSPLPGQPRLRAKVLRTKNQALIEKNGHGILAFITYEEPPVGKEQETRMIDYLFEGPTKGGVQWFGNKFDWLEQRPARIIRGGDMRSIYPLALERLLCHTLEEMQYRYASPKDAADDPIIVTAERLRHCAFRSDGPLIGNIQETGFTLANDRTFQKLWNAGFRHEGTDDNPDWDHPYARTFNVDGRRIDLRSVWELMILKLPRGVRDTRKLWDDERHRFADLTPDRFTG